MQASLAQQGIDLMLYGMGTVFVFLTFLVVATVIMSLLIKRFFPETVLEAGSAISGGVLDAKLLAVIKAAISQHRQKKKGQR